MWNFKTKIRLKKILFFVFLLFILSGAILPLHHPLAQNENKTYQYLAPLPGQPETIDVSQPNNLSSYLNNMISIFIGICAVLAVIMIVIGGIEYMTSEALHSKEGGRERMTNAMLGLLLALAAYALLYTINPKILDVDLKSLDAKSSSLFVPTVAFAQAQPTDQKYHLLAPLPNPSTGGMYDTFDPTSVGGGKDSGELTKYLNMMILLFIGICAVLAVIMIVIGGIEYMTSEALHSKEGGRERMTNAVLGLLLALLAWPLLNTINAGTLSGGLSGLTNATLTIQQRQSQVYSGKGKQYCTPITDPTSPCHPSKLSAFPNPTQASSICNGESGGNNIPSGVDQCKDGSSMSWGLFQINVIAHADAISGGVCKNVFDVRGGGIQGACLQSDANGICRVRDCNVKDQAQYQRCTNYINNPTNNIAFAAQLQKARGWGQWGANRSCGF
jgi:type IV secretory pathway VirB2 component (pilin)